MRRLSRLILIIACLATSGIASLSYEPWRAKAEEWSRWHDLEVVLPQDFLDRVRGNTDFLLMIPASAAALMIGLWLTAPTKSAAVSASRAYLAASVTNHEVDVATQSANEMAPDMGEDVLEWANDSLNTTPDVAPSKGKMATKMNIDPVASAIYGCCFVHWALRLAGVL